MIRFKNQRFEDYFIDPITAVITDKNGNVCEQVIHKNGRPYFKNLLVHVIQMHTHSVWGYIEGLDIHHKDFNKLNNSFDNLEYLSKAEHTKIHHTNKIVSEETKQKMRNVKLGKARSEEIKQKIRNTLLGSHPTKETIQKIRNALIGKHRSEETKQKLGTVNRGRYWWNNGMINVRSKECPKGFVKGRFKTQESN